MEQTIPTPLVDSSTQTNYAAIEQLDAQKLVDELLPLFRSLTGPGYEQSLKVLQRYMPLQIEEYACGSQVFDWTVPPYWKLERATLKDSSGKIVLDTEDNPLHVLNYSMPFQGKVSREELESHLYYHQRVSDAIPYVTSYYKERWGFCLTAKQYASLTDKYYYVDIRTKKHNAGAIKVAYCELKGKSDRIVQLSSYLCHPNLLNNELSGPICLVYLYTLLKALPERHFTYRFVLNPETIGSICYLTKHKEELQQRLEYGMLVNLLGTPYNAEFAESKLLQKEFKAPVGVISKADLEAISSTSSPYAQLAKLTKSVVENLEPNYYPSNPYYKLSRKLYIDTIEQVLEKGYLAKADTLETHYAKRSCLDLESQAYAQLCCRDRSVLQRVYKKLCQDMKEYTVEKSLHINSYLLGGEHNEELLRLGHKIDRFIMQRYFTYEDKYMIREFYAHNGSDERQYSSALVALPYIHLSSLACHFYPNYHSSLDNQNYMSLESIVAMSFKALQDIVDFDREFESLSEDTPRELSAPTSDEQYYRIKTCCEPLMSKRGLYHSINTPDINLKFNENLFMITLNLLDGTISNKKLAKILGISQGQTDDILQLFVEKDLVELVTAPAHT